MAFRRRDFLILAANGAALPIVSRPSYAANYPSHPVRIVVGFAAGGGNDVIARLIAGWLSDRFGQSFIVENRPGAGGNIGTEAVVRALPDGHTLLLASSPNATNATLYNKLNFDFLRDTVPVIGIMRVPDVMVVRPSFPAQSIAEFIDYAKKNPGKINMASGGIGTSPHLAGELFKMMAGVDMAHVSYRGNAPALSDLVGGQVDVMFPPTTALIEFITSGKLRALGVTTSTRVASLPGIPTIAETISGYEASTWYGIAAPKGTPSEVVDMLNSQLNSVLTVPENVKRITDLGGTVLGGSPAQFGALAADETAKWGNVVRAANLRAD